MRLRSPYDGEIFRLALPALGALAAEPLYLLVDTAIVGHLGRSQLAALGIAAAILGGVFAIFNFLQYGTTAQVARAGGAGQAETARRLGAQAVWLSLGFGIVVAILVAALAEPLVSLMGGEDDAASYAVTYLRIAAIGLPAAFLALGGQGYLRGVSDLRTPLVIIVVANAVNVVLEVLFVYGFDWGIEGSAWGTTIAQLGMGVGFVVAIFRGLQRAEALPEFALARRVLSLGKWIFLRTASLISAVRPRRGGRDALRRGVDRRASGRVSGSSSSSRSCSTRSRSPARSSSGASSARAGVSRPTRASERMIWLSVAARRRVRRGHARCSRACCRASSRATGRARRGGAAVAALRAHAAAERRGVRARRDPHRRGRRAVPRDLDG